MPLEHRTGRSGRIAVARMPESLLVRREPEPPLDGVAQPALFPLGGHEQEAAAGLEHAHHLADVGLIVLDMLEKIDGDHDVEGRGLEWHFGLAGLDDAIPNQLARGADVVALEVAAHPGTAALPEEMGREPGGTPELEAEAPLDRGEVTQQCLHCFFLLERAAVELKLPGLAHGVSLDWIVENDSGRWLRPHLGRRVVLPPKIDSQRKLKVQTRWEAPDGRTWHRYDRCRRVPGRGVNVVSHPAISAVTPWIAGARGLL